jgi:hypothetical protein
MFREVECQSCEWLINANARDNIRYVATATDPLGNVCVAFTLPGEVTLSGVGYTPRHAGDVVIMKVSQSGTILWVKQYRSSNRARLHDIHVDRQGSIFLTGMFMGGVTFGEDALTNPGYMGWQMFVAKLNADGDPLWATQSTSASQDVDVWGGAIVAGDDGGVYVAGGFSNYSGSSTTIDPRYNVTVAFGDADSITEAVTGFVAKCNAANGDFVWTTKVDRAVLPVNNGNSRATSISGSSIVRDERGNLYACFAGKFSILHHESFEVLESHLVKLTAAGGILKTIFVGPTEVNYGKVTFNSLTYAGGRLYGSGVYLVDHPIDFNGLVLDSVQPPVSPRIGGYLSESFIVAYDTSLVARSIATGGNAAVNKVSACLATTNQAGQLFAAGYFHSDTLVFGGQMLLNRAPDNMSSTFTAGYTLDGTATPVFTASSTTDHVRCYALEAYGTSAIVVGTYKGTAVFGDKGTTSNCSDLYVAKISNTMGTKERGRGYGRMASDIYAHSARRVVHIGPTQRNLEIGVVDVAGRRVRTVAGPWGGGSLDMGATAAGVFFLTREGDGRWLIERVVLE